MPSPPQRKGNGKGLKSSESSRPFNYNQNRPQRRFNQQSSSYQYDGYQRRPRQQDYYNDYIPNRRNNGNTDWPRKTQRFSRPLQNYNDNGYYSSRRM